MSKRDQQLEERWETLLRRALLEMADEEIDALEDTQNEPEAMERAEAFYALRDARFRQLIGRGVRRAHVRRRARQVGKVVAIVLAAGIVGLATLMAAVPEVRARVFEYVLQYQIQEKYMEMELLREDEVGGEENGIDVRVSE